MTTDSNDNGPSETVLREMQIALASILGTMVAIEQKASTDGGPVITPPAFVPNDEDCREVIKNVMQTLIGHLVAEFGVPDTVMDGVRSDIAEWSKRNGMIDQRLKEVVLMLTSSKEVIDDEDSPDYTSKVLKVDDLPDTPRFRRYRDN